MKVFLIIIFSLVSTLTFCQSWKWAVSAGGGKSDKGNDITHDKYGNHYIGGYYNTPSTSTGAGVSFGTLNPMAQFGKEGFLAKIDGNGNWVWVKSAIGGYDERVLGVHCDTVNDYVYATGTTWSFGSDQLQFGSCNTTAVSSDDEVFLTKFDLLGNCIWNIATGGSSDDQGYDMVTDKNGNIYLSGFISDKYKQGGVVAQFGSLNVPIPFGDSLAFVSKVSANGVFQWVQTFGGCDGSRDNRVVLDSANNVYVVGGFYGTKSFGTSTKTSAGGVDIFVVKYDKNGNFQWVETAGGLLSDRANSITIDHYNDLYITGEFRDIINFGSDVLNNYGGPNGRDIFVAKMKTNGTWLWADKAGGNGGSDRGNRIIANQKGNIFVTGQFKKSCKFSPTVILNNTIDSVQIFVAAIDTGGVWRWALQGGGDLEDRGNGLSLDDSCNLYVTGYYSNTALFGSNSVTSSGLRDIVVAKINNACFEYVNTPTVTPTPTVALVECITLIPNVFSPNNDLVNDKWQIKNNCIEKVSIQIYNRWGDLVKNFDDKSQSWDGKTNSGNECINGVYFYVGTIILLNGEEEKVKGFVSLFR